MGHEISKPPGKITPEQIAQMTDAEKHYIKKCEQFNIERVADLKLRRGKSRVLGLSLGAMAFGIYLYTLYAVKQEDLLQVFDDMPPDMKKSKE